MRYAFVVPLCLGLAAACAAPVERRGCEGAVNAAIAAVGVAPDRIASTAVSPQTESGDEHRTIGYTYWMRLKSCNSGYLIVDTNNFCHVEQVYTTGECQIGGVRHY